MQPVESSNIEAIGHDPATNTLGVKFKSGGLYHYQGISAEKHQALMAADSKGKHFFKHIRHHEFVKL
ncbi:MAG: KTSC domain-containing protein [Bryobacteraceae bacterium]|jgi:hypothetical protein